MNSRLIPVWPDYVRGVLKKKSRTSWHVLKKAGKAPRTIYVGGTEFITQELHDEWIAALARESEQQVA